MGHGNIPQEFTVRVGCQRWLIVVTTTLNNFGLIKSIQIQVQTNTIIIRHCQHILFILQLFTVQSLSGNDDGGVSLLIAAAITFCAFPCICIDSNATAIASLWVPTFQFVFFFFLFFCLNFVRVLMAGVTVTAVSSAGGGWIYKCRWWFFSLGALLERLWGGTCISTYWAEAWRLACRATFSTLLRGRPDETVGFLLVSVLTRWVEAFFFFLWE